MYLEEEREELARLDKEAATMVMFLIKSYRTESWVENVCRNKPSLSVSVCECNCVMDSPDSDNFMEHFTNENDNGYAWLNVNPLMFSIFRIISSSPSECKLLLSCLPRRVFFH